VATFGIFCGVCVVAWVWMWMYVPETKGKTLEEVEAMLRGGMSGGGGVAGAKAFGLEGDGSGVRRGSWL
jgi:predicted MFS family arabinose efflux permease